MTRARNLLDIVKESWDSPDFPSDVDKIRPGKSRIDFRGRLGTIMGKPKYTKMPGGAGRGYVADIKWDDGEVVKGSVAISATDTKVKK